MMGARIQKTFNTHVRATAYACETASAVRLNAAVEGL
jgi:hypothetical protein